jgi:hypothetical protein
MPNQQEQGDHSKAAAQVASAQCDGMSNKELRAELQRLGIETRDSMTKKDLQQLLKMATELHHVKSSSKQPSEAAATLSFARSAQKNTALMRRLKHHEFSSVATRFV